MPFACVVLGCSNRSNREIDKGYFRVPREEIKKGPRTKDFTKRRREKWLANISLSSKGAESKNARVCGDHFVKGRPSNLYDEEDIDWAPTMKLGHEKVKQPTAETLERNERLHTRDEKRKRSEDWAPSLKLTAEEMVTPSSNTSVSSASSSLRRYQRSTERYQKRKRDTAAEALLQLQQSVTETEDSMPAPLVTVSVTDQQKCHFKLSGTLGDKDASEQLSSDVTETEDSMPAVTETEDSMPAPLVTVSVTDQQKCHFKLSGTLGDKDASEQLSSDVTETEDSMPAVTGTEDSMPAVTGTEDSMPAVTETEDSMPDVTGTEDSMPAVTGTEDSMPAVTETEDSMPAVTGTEDSMPAVTETEDSMPDVTGTEDSMPDVTGTEDSMPAPLVTLSVTDQQKCHFKLSGTLGDKDASEQLSSDVCDSSICAKIKKECQRLTTENKELKDALDDTRFTEESFRNNAKKVRYYTGLPGFETLMAVFAVVAPYIPESNRVSLSKFEKLILVFMKLRLNLQVQDLAYRFGVSNATVSRTFLAVIHVMYARLDIKESVGPMCAEVKIPSFTEGKAQLPALEVESTKNIAHGRIHVERVIGLARKKYTILSGTMPPDYFSCNENEIPVVDKIVTVCCCLTNMCESVVPFN
ncbi:uncharacterized protein LOC110961112 isoform X3 [Acanthochromis polyacanthus]|uniref:uncharacterized protein LOC110961112 isoform X3 n=1 Tax=Acanthochromis polyacanthus TaxID=80966 RepID=UPI0022343D6E|nr:uncharacterized protein LOC110961112 isoform X3 [Acanthochromis polyacanthus]